MRGGTRRSGESHRGGSSGGTGKARTADGVKREQKSHRHQAASAPVARDDVYRAGFACFVGRPNAGKSTLINAMIG